MQGVCSQGSRCTLYNFVTVVLGVWSRVPRRHTVTPFCLSLSGPFLVPIPLPISRKWDAPCRNWFTDSVAGKTKDLYCLQVCAYIDSLAVHALRLVPWLVNTFCWRAAAKLLVGAVEQDARLLASVSYLFSKLFQSSASFLCTCFITYLLPYSMSFKAMFNCWRSLATLPVNPTVVF